MFSTYINSIKATRNISEIPFRSIPLSNFKNVSRKYQTPHKSCNTTNITKGNTMSFSKFTHPKQTISKKHSTYQSFHPASAKTKSKTVGTSYKSQSKGK